jgi:hypothetical protein
MNLTHAIIYGTATDVAEALRKTANINLLDEYGYTPLIETTIANDTAKAKLLIEAGADVNQKDMTARTALHWVTSNNNEEICELLLARGADANAFTIASEPVLVKPLLGNQQKIKSLLSEKGANFQFAYDYIHAKLLGHRFELIGSVDIVTPDEIFTEVDYEGFYLEFSLGVIEHSLREFRKNYAARTIEPWFNQLDTIITAFSAGQKLIQQDHYLKDYRRNLSDINSALTEDPVIIPMSQEGHTITLVKYRNLLAICNRIQDNAEDDRVPIYYMNLTNQFKSEFLAPLIYTPGKIDTIITALKSQLGLQKINHVPLHAQIIGNCSWANVEACIPALHFMQGLSDAKNELAEAALMVDALELFQRWRQWDTERALHFFMGGFSHASPARKASIGAILAAILFQTCSAENPAHIERAKSILDILKHKEYAYILESYVKFYTHDKPTKAGGNLKKLLQLHEI